MTQDKIDLIIAKLTEEIGQLMEEYRAGVEVGIYPDLRLPDGKKYGYPVPDGKQVDISGKSANIQLSL